jgi:hypothetical protein
MPLFEAIDCPSPPIELRAKSLHTASSARNCSKFILGLGMTATEGPVGTVAHADRIPSVHAERVAARICMIVLRED